MPALFTEIVKLKIKTSRLPFNGFRPGKHKNNSPKCPSIHFANSKTTSSAHLKIYSPANYGTTTSTALNKNKLFTHLSYW